MKNDNCIFCKIAAGEIPSKTLYEDEKFRVILDLGPATRGHALVIPKEHYADLYEIPEETAGEAMKVAKKMAAVMTEKLKADGFNIVQNNGEVSGQSVFHFHIHLIPRYENDGQKIGWVPGNPSGEELEEIRKTIVNNSAAIRSCLNLFIFSFSPFILPISIVLVDFPDLLHRIHPLSCFIIQQIGIFVNKKIEI